MEQSPLSLVLHWLAERVFVATADAGSTRVA